MTTRFEYRLAYAWSGSTTTYEYRRTLDSVKARAELHATRYSDRTFHASIDARVVHGDGTWRPVLVRSSTRDGVTAWSPSRQRDVQALVQRLTEQVERATELRDAWATWLDVEPERVR